MKTFITVAIASALALTGCTSHPAPTPVAKAVSALTPSIHDPVEGYNQYRVTSQLAEGLFLAGVAVMDVHYYYDIHGKLPVSSAQAKSAAPRNNPAFSGPGRYVGSVVVGPEPGVITIAWSSGALEGKTLVLLPVRSDRLCWKVDAASTTVPADALAHANIVNECDDDE